MASRVMPEAPLTDGPPRNGVFSTWYATTGFPRTPAVVRPPREERG